MPNLNRTTERTEFEQLAYELNVPITLDKHGLYTGLARALAVICVDVIMEADDYNLVADEVKRRFRAKFLYVK